MTWITYIEPVSFFCKRLHTKPPGNRESFQPELEMKESEGEEAIGEQQ